MTAADIKAARKRLGLSAEAFGARLGVSGRAVENWEQGRREPRGPAKILLRQIIETKRGEDG